MTKKMLIIELEEGCKIEIENFGGELGIFIRYIDAEGRNPETIQIPDKYIGEFINKFQKLSK